MNPTWVVVLVLAVLAVLAVIAVVARALYKAGFRLEKFKVKAGIVEAEASRTASTPLPDAAKDGPKVTQEALESAEIIRSGISAPAGSSAEIAQQARGDKSKIEDSPIKLT
jgi:hypothetical protein